MLQYNSNSQLISYLKKISSGKDMILFVEDSNLNGIYDRIAKNIFVRYKTFAIVSSNKLINYFGQIPKRGKSALIILNTKLNEIGDERINNIPNKILLDADFQLILNIPEFIQDSRVKYLKKYCIENYLIDEVLITDVVQTFYKELVEDEISNSMSFVHWKNKIFSSFCEIFSYFAFNYEYTEKNNKSLVLSSELSMKNINTFFNDQNWLICEDIIKSFFDILTNRFREATEDDADEKLKKFCEDFKIKSQDRHLDYFSGKFLLKSIHNYLRYEKKFDKIPKDCNKFIDLCFSKLNNERCREKFSFLN